MGRRTNMAGFFTQGKTVVVYVVFKYTVTGWINNGQKATYVFVCVVCK